VAFIRIDNPDEPITWFGVYPAEQRDRRPGGPCPHDCPHDQTECVGWGPDAAHYELIICTVGAYGQEPAGGCAGDCRGWFPAPGTHAQHSAVDWKHLEAAGAVV